MGWRGSSIPEAWGEVSHDTGEEQRQVRGAGERGDPNGYKNHLKMHRRLRLEELLVIPDDRLIQGHWVKSQAADVSVTWRWPGSVWTCQKWKRVSLKVMWACKRHHTLSENTFNWEWIGRNVKGHYDWIEFLQRRFTNEFCGAYFSQVLSLPIRFFSVILWCSHPLVHIFPLLNSSQMPLGRGKCVLHPDRGILKGGNPIQLCMHPVLHS